MISLLSAANAGLSMSRAIYVIGHPIGHSLSPAMHNAALEECGIDARYSAVDVPPADLEAWVAHLRANDAIGFNVTVPHKEAVLKHLDEIGGDAALVGAVNTVIRSPALSGRGSSKLVGANTDAIGFRKSLSEEAG